VTHRVALYAVPGGALGRRAQSWFGDGVPAGWTRAEVDALTVHPRRYGFHATLKAPFRLAAGRTLPELVAAVAALTAGHDAVEVPDLQLALLSGFYALVPGGPAPALHALAGALVTGVDDHRAPATAAETARRDPASLRPRQRELLAAWGYPHVLDEFRPHLTLTDRVPPPDRPRVEAALAATFAGCLGRTVPVDAVAVCTESEPGAPFRPHALLPLRPAATTPRVTAPDAGRLR